MKSRLGEFESYIQVKARSFARKPVEVSDFEQEGRIAAWQALQKDPDATKSYVQQRIDWMLLNYSNRYVHKNPEEYSADEMFSGIIWGETEYE